VSFATARLSDAAGRTYGIDAGLPRINYERFNGHRACAAWAITFGDAAGKRHFADQALIKVDMCATDTPLVVWQQPSHYPSEPVFVARPGGVDEDDGVVLSAVLDGPKAQSYVLVLDAKTMTELARVYNPAEFKVPYSVHGQFYAA